LQTERASRLTRHQYWHPIELILRPAILNGGIAAIDETGVADSIARAG
jgi:hypothetical protein